MKIKQLVNKLLLVYGALGCSVTIFGGLTNDTFFVLFGLVIAVIGLIMAQAAQTRQIIYNLKKNNLWDDEVQNKVKLPKDMKEKLDIAEIIFDENEKLENDKK